MSRQNILVRRLVDGSGRLPIDNAVITTSGSTITWTGTQREMERRDVPEELIDYGAATALPGLVDSHIHLSLPADGRTYEQMTDEPDELLAIVGVHNAAVHLKSGVTTVRDNGGIGRLGLTIRNAITRGFALGPRVLASGRPVTQSGDHFHWCRGSANGPTEIRRAVQLLAAEGADHIKVMASGGGTAGSNPRRATYSVDELRVAVDTAHELGLLTTAHCRATESMSRAIEAGVDCMEHGEFLDSDGEMRFNAEVAARLIDSDMFFSPTLQSNSWDTTLRLRQKKEEMGLNEVEAALLAATEHEIEVRLEHFHRLLELGLGPRIICGTDAGPFDYSFGHMSYGIELMVAGGMSPLEAILASTSVSAKACGVGDVVGRVAQGLEADFVILDGDPLEDVATLSRVLAVYQGGKAVYESISPIRRSLEMVASSGA